MAGVWQDTQEQGSKPSTGNHPVLGCTLQKFGLKTEMHMSSGSVL